MNALLKAAMDIACKEHNDIYGEEPAMVMNRTTLKEGYFYGEHKMQETMNQRIDELNKMYLKDTGWMAVADGQVRTRWSRKDNFGFACQKIKFTPK